MALVVLYNKKGKKFLVDNQKDFHSDQGLIKKENLKDSGLVKTHTGKKFFLFKPSFIDLFKKIKRGPQILTQKDIGYIIAKTGINKKSVCLDAGTGSGALTFSLSNISKKVYSYEIREDFYKLAQENKEFLQLKNVSLKNRDIYQGIDEEGLDLITLDLPDPHKVLSHAQKALKTGGFLVAYLPQVSQVSTFVKKLKKTSFLQLETTELIKRNWHIDNQRSRPKSRMIAHTAFLTFARKIE